ncbi:hypothetical protein ACFL00_00525 [Pseudomonadota bacterium]
MNKVLMTLLLLTTSLTVFAAEGFSSLEEQMTGKEFEAAGLEKLSPQELGELNSWIRKHSLATLATATAKPAATEAAPGPGKEDKKKDDGDRSTITSKLVGTFSGWDGQTLFKLENGQIWAQKGKKKFHSEEIDNPVVTVEPVMFGGWRLQVEGVDKKCKVVRIQ